MAKKKKKRVAGVTAPPSKADNTTAAQRTQRKEFLRALAKADRIVAFIGGGNVSHHGFKSDGDLLLFLQEQVYAHRGGDIPVFMSILESIAKAQQEAAAKAADPDIDDVFDEFDEEEVDAKKEDEKIVPMKKKRASTEEEAAVLRARLAELEGDDEEDEEGA